MRDSMFFHDALVRLSVPGFKVTETKTESYELFFVKGQLETVRRTDTTDIDVTVYVDHDGTTGSSSFAFYPSEDEEALRLSVERALSRARLVSDEAYDLPEGGRESYTDDGDMSGIEPTVLAAELADVAFCAARPAGAAINALEVFIKDTSVRVVNHRGIDKTQTRRTAAMELIPTYDGKDGSVELYEYYNLASFDREALSARISARMSDVQARMQASVPQEKLSCPVLLNAGELRVLFGTLARDFNYAAAYNHSNLYKIGDTVQSDPQGDRLTLHACAKVEGSPSSASFDSDGTTLTDRTLIRDGIAVGQYGSHRFARYLGCEPTGNLPCLRVEAGSADAAALRDGAHLECVYLSGLQVDLFNDYIGGEVRLAYYCDGEVRTPVTGISVSGKLSEVLRKMQLSCECETFGAYHGPTLGRFEGMEIF